MTTFTGVLAVIGRETGDHRLLGEPADPIAYLPITLYQPKVFGPAGSITTIWRVDNLIHYSGELNPEHQTADQIAADIADERLVGMVEINVYDSKSHGAKGWRVAAVALLPPKEKPWPEVTLTLGP